MKLAGITVLLAILGTLGLAAGIATGQSDGSFWLHCSSVPLVCNEEAVPTVTDTVTETVTESTETTEPPPPPPTPNPPVAAFTFEPSAPVVGEPVHFDGTISECDETPCTYAWADDGPDGPGGTQWPLGAGEEIDFTFQSSHMVWARLTVTDANGASDTVMNQFNVATSPAPPPPPPPPPSPPPPSPPPPPPPSGDCDLDATPSNFSAQVSAAQTGQVVCLASGSYGTWQGTSKAITLRAAAGATPTMRYSFTTGDQGFTLDGLAGMGGSITNGAHDITIRNSTFNTHATFDNLANSNILFDHNTHANISSPSGAPNARLGFYWGSSTPSGVTIQNSLLSGGDSDGVHTGVAVDVLSNEFANICDGGVNHTDNIQFEGAVGGRIAGNYIHATCTTQGLTSYDSGTVGVVIEDNVIDIRRTWGIEFYADRDSIIRHNTVRWYAPGCYGNQPCGLIDINRKSADPAGSGTQVYDNVAIVTVNNGSTTARNDHNVSGQNVTYVGPLTSYGGFRLVAPKGTASDGLDVGIR